MSRMTYTSTDEELLELLSHCCTKKEYNIFVEDLNRTKNEMKDIIKKMSADMLGGLAQNEEEKETIKTYNKLCRHYNKLRFRLERSTYCL